jgi:hypothetical protein
MQLSSLFCSQPHLLDLALSVSWRVAEKPLIANNGPILHMGTLKPQHGES